VWEYGNHQFLPNRTQGGLYGLAPGGSCLPLHSSVEPLCLLESPSFPSPCSSWPFAQKMPSRFSWEVDYSLVSQEETPHGSAVVEKMLVDHVDRNARSRTAGNSYGDGDGDVDPSTTKWVPCIESCRVQGSTIGIDPSSHSIFSFFGQCLQIATNDIFRLF
jgi:hypothetical protein